MILLQALLGPSFLFYMHVTYMRFKCWTCIKKQLKRGVGAWGQVKDVILLCDCDICIGWYVCIIITP